MKKILDLSRRIFNPARLRGLSSPLSVARILSQIVTLVGGFVLFGWVFDVGLFKSVWPGAVTMKANSAFCFILAGTSLGLALRRDLGERMRSFAKACSVTIIVVGVFTLSEDLFGWKLGIDQLLFREPVGAVGTFSPGRMAPTASFNFILLGFSLLLLAISGNVRVSHALALSAVPFSLMSLIGYAYGVRPFYGIASYTEMSMHTALTFMLLCLGILLARPERGPVRVATSDSTGGLVARRLLPATIVIPGVLGWLVLAGQRKQLFDTEFGLSLIVLSSILIFATLILWNARSLYFLDLERRRAEEAIRLERYSIELEQANRRLRKMDEMKSNFIALASHELKTPLTAILGFLTVIFQEKVGVLTKKQKEFLNLAREATERLNRLVDELLDISKIESGQTRMKMEPAHLGKLLKEEVRVFQPQAASKEIELETAIESPLKVVPCDRDKIKEVLDNLMSNAIKYTPRGGRVQVEAKNLEEAIQIEVRDTGIGIREEEQEKIFEPFRSTRAGLDGEKSTGLGLTLVKKIIEAHGGGVSVQSQEGKGSVFSVTLPVVNGRTN